MFRQRSSKNRRFSNASQGNYAHRSSGNRDSEGSGNNSYRGGYRPYGRNNRRFGKSNNNWTTKNRRFTRESIAYSKYIFEAEDNKGIPQYIPERNFYDFDFHKILAQNILDRGYVNPTKIQDKAIPEIVKGKDILGIGNTGSGKTGTFLIPMIDKVLKDPRNRVLIISPTRELSSQINNEFREFAKNTGLKIVLVIGGANIRDQIHLLKMKPHFVVATPGRLMDLEKRHCININSFNNVVLDEVDQMLDMGFVEDIKSIISKLAEKRQSLFFSATMSPKEEVIANTLLNNPIKVEADKASPLTNIQQDVVKVRSQEHKIEVLCELLKKIEFNKVLIFSQTKFGADKISKELREKGIAVDSLHGDKSQIKRSKVLANFRQDKIDVLVATDVAARGIDIPNISHVINYDEPATYKDYIHRIGRTGRIGKKGNAVTFIVDRGYRS